MSKHGYSQGIQLLRPAAPPPRGEGPEPPLGIPGTHLLPSETPGWGSIPSHLSVLPGVGWFTEGQPTSLVPLSPPWPPRPPCSAPAVDAGGRTAFSGAAGGRSGSRRLGAILLRTGWQLLLYITPESWSRPGGLEAKQRRWSSPRYGFRWLLTLSVRYGAAEGRSPRGSAQPAAGRPWMGATGLVPALPCERAPGEQGDGGTIFGRFFDVSQRWRQPQELVQATAEWSRLPVERLRFCAFKRGSGAGKRG